MIVSMLQVILEMPGVTSIKEKRQRINSLKQRIIRKYKVSAAEVDLHDSLSFAQLGVAVVSNSRRYGEGLMNKILNFCEDEFDGRVHDTSIYSENYQ